MKSFGNHSITRDISRDNNIELLRLILMFMIVLLHMISHGLDFIPTLIKGIYNNKIELSHIIAFSFCIIGVNCFVFISGFFGIRFKLESLINFEKQSLFTSIFILIISLFFHTPVSKRIIIGTFFPVLSNYWWFLSVYILLFILAPFINAGIEKIGQKEFKLTLILLFLFNCFGGYIWGTFNSNEGYSILNFIFLYLLARYMKIYNVVERITCPVLLYFIFLILLIVLGYYLYITFQFKIFLKLYNYNNPIVIICSVMFFIIFKKMKVNKDIRWLSKLTFGIYLFSDNDFVRNNIPSIFEKNNSIIFVIAVAAIIFLISACLEYSRQMIFNFFQKRQWSQS